MAQAAPPARKTQLLEEIVEHLLERGVEDMTMRSLAAGIGTSHQLLLYYFGSKEELLRAVYTGLRQRFIDVVLGSVPDDAKEMPGLVRLLWDAMLADPRVLPLMTQINGLSLVEPARYGTLARQHIHESLAVWEEEFRRWGLTGRRARAMATLGFAAVRGLQMDLVSTNEHERIEGAMRELEDFISHQAVRRRAQRRSATKDRRKKRT